MDLLATVRCQAGTRRLWIRMRYIIQAGTILTRAESVKVFIYALPAGAPRVARLITLRLPVLPHYSQHEDLSTEVEKRYLNAVCKVVHGTPTSNLFNKIGKITR